MKKVHASAFTIIFIPFAFLGSCKKEADDPKLHDSFYIKAKFNGEQKIFNTSMDASTNYYVGPYYLVISDSTYTEIFKITVWSDNPIKTGDVFELSTVNGKDNNMIYGDIASYPNVWYGVYNPFISGGEKFQCKIIERAKGFVKGIFSGSLVESKYTDPRKIEVTEGEFVAQIFD